MRWNIGDVKVKWKFLWTPMMLKDGYGNIEIRHLEFSRIVYKYDHDGWEFTWIPQMWEL